MAETLKERRQVRAKLFMNGRSQAVRLPKDFRFEGREVRIRHAEGGGVLLEPIPPEERTWKTVDQWVGVGFSCENRTGIPVGCPFGSG
jgi:antitoxin VapB